MYTCRGDHAPAGTAPPPLKHLGHKSTSGFFRQWWRSSVQTAPQLAPRQ